VTTWFSPYQSYLFGYAPADLNGQIVAGYIPDYIERIKRLSKGLPVFVDQFNFRHFGGLKGEAALADEKQELDMISNGLPAVLRSTLGYALWNHTDYYMNVTFNGSFRFGLDDWDTSTFRDGVRMVEQKPFQAQVEIQPGSWIRQQVSVQPGQEYTLEFDAQGAGQIVEARIEFPNISESMTRPFVLSGENQRFQWKVIVPGGEGNLSLTFVPGKAEQSIRIGNILLYPWIDTGGIYRVDGQPRGELRDMFRKINLSATGSDK
jgi:hypothetical protein